VVEVILEHFEHGVDLVVRVVRWRRRGSIPLYYLSHRKLASVF
jgi:hypothetical protein